MQNSEKFITFNTTFETLQKQVKVHKYVYSNNIHKPYITNYINLCSYDYIKNIEYI